MTTIIFQDDLIHPSSSALLEAWAPDVGTGYTRLWGTDASTRSLQVVTTGVRTTGNSGDYGLIYTFDTTYLSADYDNQFTYVGTFSDITPLYALLRVQDQENTYAVRLRDGTGNCRLYKKVSGTWTALGSAFDPPADGSVCKLEMIGTALKFYDDGVEIASATDSDITSAGKAGMAHGGGAELVASTDDTRAFVMFHTLTVTDLGTAVVEKSASETDDVSLAEAVAVQAGLSASETDNVSIADASAIQAGVSGSESEDVSLAEASAIQAGLSVSETEDVSLAEAVAIQAELNASETEDITLTDTSAVQAGLAASEAEDVSLGESALIDIPVSTSDPVDVSLGESASIAVFVTVTDSAGVEASEGTVSIAASSSRADTQDISLTEVGSILSSLDVSDSENVSVLESASAVVILQVSDGLAISIADASAIQTAISDLYGVTATITEVLTPSGSISSALPIATITPVDIPE